ncbi:site-specific integrase [Anaerosporobacter faecicola]|uniref:site-specific integrase n=1 Tax=Anaerosporobacter faecicola TaxID=2718714 RepID=UPI0014395B16|nr:tyrosine-type recombinase/integrase [Anaerosporobacter faecicola]
MSLIFRQSLQYAVDKKLISFNPFADIKIEPDMFHTPPEKEDETQVYLVDEVKPIINEARADFIDTGNLAALAIPFAFQTGVRLGELVAIKCSDIRGRYLHIQRMEIKEQKQDYNGKWLPASRTVVERTKSKAGKRKIYLTDEAIAIIDAAISEIKQNGYSDEDYLFQDIRGRISSRAVDSRIRKYCDHINISHKSTHKVRKTYISTLIDSGININKICQTVGHESTKTTYGNYCYNRYSQEQTEEQFEKALKF